MKRILFYVAVLSSNFGHFIFAQNTEFIPGDAFFCSKLNQELIDDFARNAELYYQLPPGGNFGGFVGFDKLRIRRFDDEAQKSLKLVYRMLRTRNPKIVRETLNDVTGEAETTEHNPFRLMVYNRAVDWKKVRIGIKYNESWRDFPPYALQPDNSGRLLSPGSKHRPSYSSFVPRRLPRLKCRKTG